MPEHDRTPTPEARAKPFSDSRRARFVRDMITGLVIAGHVHLSKVARAIAGSEQDIRHAEKRLSLHLSSEHWDASPLRDGPLERSASLVTDDSLIVADLTDLAKLRAKKLQGLGRVHDGSDPDGRIVPGYMVFEAYVRVGRWQPFPMRPELLETYSGAPTSENAEIIDHARAIHDAAGRKGTWVFDAGFDRRESYGPMVRMDLAFVTRLVGTREVLGPDGRACLVRELVDSMRPARRPRRWPRGGYTATARVRLPEVSEEEFPLAACWRYPDSERPLMPLVSPRARRPGRTGRWYVRAYRKRWGVGDATRGVKRQFTLELFLVRSWRGISRLLVLVGWAFWWLNPWGEEGYTSLREAILAHPWRLPKEVTYLFDWIAYMLRLLPHPRPVIPLPDT